MNRNVHYLGSQVGWLTEHLNGTCSLVLVRDVEWLPRGLAWTGPRPHFRWLNLFLKLEVGSW